LNEKVDYLFNMDEIEHQNRANLISSSKQVVNCSKRKFRPIANYQAQHKKTEGQKELLEQYYSLNPGRWEKSLITHLAKTLHLSPMQIYKWNWERCNSGCKQRSAIESSSCHFRITRVPMDKTKSISKAHK
jgi:hypothetical protein